MRRNKALAVLKDDIKRWGCRVSVSARDIEMMTEAKGDTSHVDRHIQHAVARAIMEAGLVKIIREPNPDDEGGLLITGEICIIDLSKKS